MQSEKVYLSLRAIDEFRNLHPEDAKTVLGVLSSLGDDDYRSKNKYDLYYNDEFSNKPVWAIVEGRVFVSFLELEDGTVRVSHLSLISKFRIPYRPQWG